MTTLKVSCYDTQKDIWTYKVFETKAEKAAWLRSIIKLPGECNYDSRVLMVNELARKFDKDKVYCDFVEDTFEFEHFWDRQKELSYTGILIDEEFYIPGDEYFYLNFLKIPDKVKGDFAFPRLQDLDVWAFQCVELALLEGRFMSILKARQTGFTLKFVARMIKRLWFESSFAGKIAAFEERPVKSAWDDILVPYRAHLHEHTAWKREFEPSDKSLNWKQGYKTKINDKFVLKGNLSGIRGVTTQNNASAVVAGKTDEILYDEAGVSLNLTKVLEFAEPALKYGNVMTGTIWMLGAAGETSQSEALQTVFNNPRANNCLEFPNVWSGRPEEMVGMFVPYYYAYGDCIDKYGNSLIEKAKEVFQVEAELKKEKGHKEYMIYKAQYPGTPEDAFSIQVENIFPTEIIQPWYERLTRSFKETIVTLKDDDTKPTGIKHEFGSDSPLITDFPVPLKADKRGALVVDEFPPLNPEPGLYYVVVDPIRSVKTTTSYSLHSIHVMKAAHRIEGEFTEDKLVAWYCGRHDDAQKTFDLTRKVIKWYNARAAIESDQASCIEWMIKMRMTGHLMKRSDMPILKDWVPTSQIHEEYGFRTGSGNTKILEHLYSLIIEYCREEIATEFDDKGNSRIVYGVERIKDKMLLKELLTFNPKKNHDRIISFGAALMVTRANTNRGIMAIKRAAPKGTPPKITRTLLPQSHLIPSPFYSKKIKYR